MQLIVPPLRSPSPRHPQLCGSGTHLEPAKVKCEPRYDADEMVRRGSAPLLRVPGPHRIGGFCSSHVAMSRVVCGWVTVCDTVCVHTHRSAYTLSSTTALGAPLLLR